MDQLRSIIDQLEEIGYGGCQFFFDGCSCEWCEAAAKRHRAMMHNPFSLKVGEALLDSAILATERRRKMSALQATTPRAAT